MHQHELTAFMVDPQAKRKSEPNAPKAALSPFFIPLPV